MAGPLESAQHHWLRIVSARFRFGACVGAALITMVWLLDARARTGAAIAVAYLLAAPWVFSRIDRVLGLGARAAALECLLTAWVLGWCGLPVAQVIAIAGLFLIGLTARDGLHAVVVVMLSVAAGWGRIR